jgi:hypothetical protein
LKTLAALQNPSKPRVKSTTAILPTLRTPAHKNSSDVVDATAVIAILVTLFPLIAWLTMYVVETLAIVGAAKAANRLNRLIVNTL